MDKNRKSKPAVVMPKRKIDRGGAIVQYQDACSELECAYAKTLMNPEDFDPVRAPVTPVVESAIYKSITTLEIGLAPAPAADGVTPVNAALATNLGFIALSFPDLRQADQVTANTTTTPAIHNGIWGNGTYMSYQQDVSVGAGQLCFIEQPYECRNALNNYVYPVEKTPTGSVPQPVFSWGSVAAGGADTMRYIVDVSPPLPATSRCDVTLYTLDNSGTWTTSVAATQDGSYHLDFGNLALPGDPTVAFGLKHVFSEGFTGRMTGTMVWGNQATRLWNLPNVPNHVIALDAPALDEIAEGGALRKRVIAMSHWVQNNTPDLSRGGRIAAARLPGQQNLGRNTSVFSMLADVPTQSYQGKGADGAYGFWLPDDERSFFFTGLADRELDAPFLVSAGVLPTVAQQFVLRVVRGVEYTTSSQLFEQRIASPCSEFMDVVAVIRTIPAFMENPLHKKIISKAAALLKSKSFWSKIAKGVTLGASLLV